MTKVHQPPSGLAPRARLVEEGSRRQVTMASKALFTCPAMTTAPAPAWARGLSASSSRVPFARSRAPPRRPSPGCPSCWGQPPMPHLHPCPPHPLPQRQQPQAQPLPPPALFLSAAAQAPPPHALLRPNRRTYPRAAVHARLHCGWSRAAAVAASSSACCPLPRPPALHGQRFHHRLHPHQPPSLLSSVPVARDHACQPSPCHQLKQRPWRVAPRGSRPSLLAAQQQGQLQGRGQP